MSINAAENHYNWRVQIGHHDRPSNWGHGCALLWNQTGYGCLIHPRIVLTSLSVWKSAVGNRYGYDVFARVCAEDDEPDKDMESNEDGGDQLSRKCQLGHAH